MRVLPVLEGWAAMYPPPTGPDASIGVPETFTGRAAPEAPPDPKLPRRRRLPAPRPPPSVPPG
ncbi:hypothetical protein ACE1SV_64510 [Streptomyces sp. E-15]